MSGKHSVDANYLILQPYGAAVVNNELGRIEGLNETATIIAIGILKNKSYPEIAKEICSEFEVKYSEAISDVENFMAKSIANQFIRSRNKWIIQGNSDRTSIVQADIELTLACGFNCTYCFANAGTKSPNELSTGEWLNVANWLLKQGVKQVTITGGDPLLSEAFWPLVEHFTNAGVKMQIFTNGSQINSQTVNKLGSLNLNFIQITLDALSEDKNDRFRGKGSYKKTIKAIELLNNQRIPVVIASNIFPDTITEIEKLAEFAYKHEIKLRCGPIDAHGRAQSMDESLTKNSVLNQLILDEIERVNHIYPNVFIDKDIINMKTSTEFKCKFYHGMVAVGSDGRLRPCLESVQFFKEVAPWALDQRKCYELRNIEDYKAFDIIKSIDRTFLPTTEKCKGCPKYKICQGCLLAGYTCATTNLHYHNKQEKR